MKEYSYAGGRIVWVSPPSLQVPNPGAKTPLLRVHNLGVHIRGRAQDRLRLLDGIGFHVNAGEAVGLLGESGSGKTTLAKAISGLLPSETHFVEGVITFGGIPLLALKENDLRKIRGAQLSLVHQDSSVLNPVLRVGDQIVEVLRAHRNWSRQQCRDRAMSLLEDLEISDAERIYAAYPHQLSGGQRQRVGLAQALACEPALLIADEPTSSLDAGAAADFLRLLGQLKQRRGTALLLISHDSVVLAKVSDRIMIMYAGRVVEQGLTGEVLETPIHPYTCALLGCELQSQPVELQRPGKNRMLTITGRPPDPSHERFGCDFFNRCPDKLDLCRARVPEEIHVSNFHSTRCFKVGG